MDTCATNFDTLLSVSRARFWTIAAVNNDCPSGFGSKLNFNAPKDQTYYIGVDGCCGAPQGIFTLALNPVDNVAPVSPTRLR